MQAYLIIILMLPSIAFGLTLDPLVFSSALEDNTFDLHTSNCAVAKQWKVLHNNNNYDVSFNEKKTKIEIEGLNNNNPEIILLDVNGDDVCELGFHTLASMVNLSYDFYKLSNSGSIETVKNLQGIQNPETVRGQLYSFYRSGPRWYGNKFCLKKEIHICEDLVWLSEEIFGAKTIGKEEYYFLDTSKPKKNIGSLHGRIEKSSSLYQAASIKSKAIYTFMKPKHVNIIGSKVLDNDMSIWLKIKLSNNITGWTPEKNIEILTDHAREKKIKDAYRKKDLTQLLEASREAMGNTNNIEYMNNLAYYLQKLGEHKEAAFILDQLLEKKPKRTVAYFNLADSLHALGDRQGAIKNYKIYVEQMTANGKAEKIPQRVKDYISKYERTNSKASQQEKENRVSHIIYKEPSNAGSKEKETSSTHIENKKLFGSSSFGFIVILLVALIIQRRQTPH